MKRFKFLPVAMGSGWPSGHVAVDEWIDFPSTKGSGEIILTLDTQDFAEFSREIDELIAELEEVRKVAKRKFAKVGR